MQSLPEAKTTAKALGVNTSVFKSLSTLTTKIDTSDDMIKAYDEVFSELLTNNVVAFRSPTGSGKSTALPLFLYLRGFRTIYVALSSTVSHIGIFAYTNKLAGILIPETDRAPLIGYWTAREKDFNSDTNIIFTTVDIIRKFLYGRYSNDSSNFTNISNILILDDAHIGKIDYSLILLMYAKAMRQENAQVNKLLLLSSSTMESTEIRNLQPRRIDINYQPFSIDVIYSPLSENELYISKIGSILKKLISEKQEDGQPLYGKKSILVFLPGIAEIDQLNEMLSEEKSIVLFTITSKTKKDIIELTSTEPKYDYLPRVILATNIAEYSITIANLAVVIDTMREKVEVRGNNYKSSTWVTQYISKQSADQRKGRVGRVFDGICYRIISESAYQKLPDDKISEIHTTNIDHIVLDMVENNINPVDILVTLDTKTVYSTMSKLLALDVITPQNELSETGIFCLGIPLLVLNAKTILNALIDLNEKDLLVSRPAFFTELCIALCISETGGNFFHKSTPEVEETIETYFSSSEFFQGGVLLRNQNTLIGESTEEVIERKYGRGDIRVYLNVIKSYMNAMAKHINKSMKSEEDEKIKFYYKEVPFKGSEVVNFWIIEQVIRKLIDLEEKLLARGITLNFFPFTPVKQYIVINNMSKYIFSAYGEEGKPVIVFKDAKTKKGGRVNVFYLEKPLTSYQ